MSATRPCPACAKAVDPLRAGQVAIFGDSFYYFCDLTCRERFAPRASVTRGFPPIAKADGDRLPVSQPSRPSLPAPSRPPPQPTAAARQEGSRLRLAAMAAGLMAMTLALAGPSFFVVALRIAIAFAGFGLVVWSASRAATDPADAHPALLLAPGAAACLVATAALFSADAILEQAVMLAGLIVVELALSLELGIRGRQPEAAARRWIGSLLWSTPAGSSAEGAHSTAVPGKLKSGAECVVSAGDAVIVDGLVVAGEAMVVPWLGADETQMRREGDWILAGARVASGEVRMRAVFTGFDRAWGRLLLDPRRRADVHARLARQARHLVNRGGPAAACLAGVAAFANHGSPFFIALSAVAAYAAIAHAAVAAAPAIHVARGVLDALRRGIVYRAAADWDRAGDVSIAAFCARGTLLLGEPDLADLQAIGKLPAEEVLALAAGAESASSHAVATAIRRAATARNIEPNAVRSPVVHPRLGVSAIAASGEPLLVGGRALMLREKVSVAGAEQKIAEIEAHGREVLLVAAGGKLVGVMGLQDGLRPGARAAVQHLLDAEVEPVLLSGDSRETCEAIGRALDIDHVRAEILAEDRPREIERLAQGGLTVAVVGRSRADEGALSAAHVAVAMPAHGASGEWAVMLASDDVRDAALAISLARRCKSRARTSLLLALAPPIVFSLLAAFGLLPPAFGPLAAIAGAVAAGLHARPSERGRSWAPSEARAVSPPFTGRLAKSA